MFHGDLGGVLDLLVRAAEQVHEARGGHGCGRADLALTPRFGARDARVRLDEPAHNGRDEQKLLAREVGVGHADDVDRVPHDRRDDARRPVRRRRHHATTRGVLLIDGDRVSLQPLERAVALARRVEHAKVVSHPGCPARHPQPARQDARGAQAGVDAVVHRACDGAQRRARCRLTAQSGLVGACELRDAQPVLAAEAQQLIGRVEPVRHLGRASSRPGVVAVTLDEAAAHRVVGLVGNHGAGRVARCEA